MHKVANNSNRPCAATMTGFPICAATDIRGASAYTSITVITPRSQ
jgi:hypothetical protein